MNSKKDKLCVFGCYQDSELYPRNRTLITALSALFSRTIEIRPIRKLENKSTQRPLASLRGIVAAITGSLSSFFSLYRQKSSLNEASLIYIPYPAYLDLIFLRIITAKKSRPIVAIDAFLCLHDTVVDDRKLVKANSLTAKSLCWLEAATLRHADLIFIDTELQKQQLANSYPLTAEKIVVTPVGIDESIWSPLPALPLETDFHVLFWGTFIPLHGIETIISAAQLLLITHPNIKFRLIGDGQTATTIANQLRIVPLENVEWIRELVSARLLRSYVENSHCILGVFGKSIKAGNVIPYKAYQAMASNRILITRSSPAFSSFQGQGNEVSGLTLVPPGSPEELAAAIVSTYRHYAEICDRLETRLFYESFLSNLQLQKSVETGINNIFD